MTIHGDIEDGIPDVIIVPKHERAGLTLDVILDRWSLVEADLMECYGVDLYDGHLKNRPARSLLTLILGLLSTDSRLSRSLSPKDKDN